MKPEQFKSIVRSAFISAAGAALAVVTAWASDKDFGQAGPLVGGILAWAVNTVRVLSQTPTAEQK